MKKYNLENKIKDSFDNHQFQLNHDEIWENIEPELKGKKKRRFFFIWFFGGTMLLASLFRYAYTSVEGDSKIVADTMMESSFEKPTALPIQGIEIAPTIQTEEKPQSNSVAIKNQSSNVVPKIKRQKGNAVAFNSNRFEYNYEVDKTSLSKTTTDNNTNSATPLIVLKDVVEESRYEKSNDNLLVEMKVREELRQAEIAMATKGITEEKAEDVAIEESPLDTRQIVDKEPKNKVIAGKTAKGKSSTKNDRSKKKNKKYSSSSDRSKKKNKKESGSNDRSKKKNKKDNDSDEKSKKVRTRKSRRKASYFVQPSLSYIVPFNSLTSKDGEFNKTFQIRQDTESRLEAFGAGFNLYRQSRNGFIMLAGIEYQRINTSVGFSSVRKEMETIQGIISITENAQGQVIDQEFGNKVITKIITKEQRTFNHHTFVNIPIGVGKFWGDRNYYFKILSGFDFNIYHNFKGTIKDANSDINISRRNSRTFEGVFKKKTGMGLWMSSEFAKPISKNTYLWVAPRIQIPFSNINTEEYILKQRFFNLNVSVGVNLRLN